MARDSRFADAYRSYYRAMAELAQEMMALFALALDLPERSFDDKIDRHMTNLTANYYPAQRVPPAPGELRKGHHSDWAASQSFIRTTRQVACRS